MKRTKPGVGNYVVLLGGRLEEGEKPEETVIREVLEESGVIIANPRLVFIENPVSKYGDQYIFVCDYVDGEPELPEDSEEHELQQVGYGTFEPVWMPIVELERSKVPFRSERLKEEMLNGIKNSFPDTPKRWTPA